MWGSVLFGSYADSNEGKMVACLERSRSKSPSGDVCSEEMFNFFGCLDNMVEIFEVICFLMTLKRTIALSAK